MDGLNGLICVCVEEQSTGWGIHSVRAPLHSLSVTDHAEQQEPWREGPVHTPAGMEEGNDGVQKASPGSVRMEWLEVDRVSRSAIESMGLDWDDVCVV